MISAASSACAQENSSQTSAPSQGQHSPEMRCIPVLCACGSGPNAVYYKHRFPTFDCWPCQTTLSKAASEGCRQVTPKVGSPVASHGGEVKGLHVGDPRRSERVTHVGMQGEGRPSSPLRPFNPLHSCHALKCPWDTVPDKRCLGCAWRAAVGCLAHTPCSLGVSGSNLYACSVYISPSPSKR